MLFENCYVDLIMTVLDVEVFDGGGRYIHPTRVQKVVTLHPAQANDEIMLNKIKAKMWDDLMKEKQWKPVTKLPTSRFVKMCKFEFVQIPAKSKPITYKEKEMREEEKNATKISHRS